MRLLQALSPRGRSTQGQTTNNTHDLGRIDDLPEGEHVLGQFKLFVLDIREIQREIDAVSSLSPLYGCCVNCHRRCVFLSVGPIARAFSAKLFDFLSSQSTTPPPPFKTAFSTTRKRLMETFFP